ncbi:DUF5362 family protein [Arachidicoccus sp.]|jgi:hypothetical protein|uniref:DUF5362 family protein n=1 Tax=Arachidicoccus sp. TaxID=1872624 RepID=UPI003D227990
MEENQFLEQEKETLHFSATVKSTLASTTVWTKFLAIAGFAMIGLLILVGIGITFSASIASSLMPTPYPGLGLFSATFIVLLYILIGLLYLYPTNQLYHFSKKMKLAITTTDQQLLEQALEHQRKMFKFIGILLIVILCIYALIFLLLMIIGAIGSIR